MSSKPSTPRNAATFAFFDLLVALGRKYIPYAPTREAPTQQREPADDGRDDASASRT